MQKKLDIQELDLPRDDVDCWEKYPKHRWMYELSRLLDAQQVKWSPYKTALFNHRCTNLHLDTDREIVQDGGYIYVSELTNEKILTEVFIIKGEIKFIRHLSPEIKNLIGGIELRINAFVALYFQKFTGVISVVTHSDLVYKIMLRPQDKSFNDTDQEIIKLLRRIYKRTDISLSGPSGDRALHESFAS